MPLHEYRRRSCRRRFERLERTSANHSSTCPSCGAGAGRLLAAPALQFKGSGWYVTDSAGRGGNHDLSTRRPADGAPSGNPSPTPVGTTKGVTT